MMVSEKVYRPKELQEAFRPFNPLKVRALRLSTFPELETLLRRPLGLETSRSRWLWFKDVSGDLLKLNQAPGLQELWEKAGYPGCVLCGRRDLIPWAHGFCSSCSRAIRSLDAEYRMREKMRTQTLRDRKKAESVILSSL